MDGHKIIYVILQLDCKIAYFFACFYVLMHVFYVILQLDCKFT